MQMGRGRCEPGAHKTPAGAYEDRQGDWAGGLEHEPGPPELRPGVHDDAKGAQGPTTDVSASCRVCRKMAARHTNGCVRSAAEAIVGSVVVRDAHLSGAGSEHQWPAASRTAACSPPEGYPGTVEGD